MPAVRASFVASDRTYGARRIWRYVLEGGFSCDLHKIERLMRAQALRARPRRRALPRDDGERSASAIASNVPEALMIGWANSSPQNSTLMPRAPAAKRRGPGRRRTA